MPLLIRTAEATFFDTLKSFLAKILRNNYDIFGRKLAKFIIAYNNKAKRL